MTLRPPFERDLGAIEEGIRDPDVVAWIGTSGLSADEELERSRDGWLDGTAATFAICGSGDECSGLVWVELDDAGRGTIGYWLLPEAKGRGLATRSVRLLSRWALRDLGLARISLLMEPSNDASLRVAERSGFHHEGVLRSYVEVNGRRVDCVAYSLLPDDLGR